MNTKAAIEMQNTFGRFIQLYHLNQLDDAVELFAEEGRLWLPDRGIDATGTEAVAAALHAMQEERRAKGYRRDSSVAHTPAYDTIENDTVGVATWDVHTFDFAATKDGSDKIEYIYGRVDAKFREVDGKWKFTECDWWEVQSFVPWDYDKAEDDGLALDLSDIPAPPAYGGHTTVRDFYAIQSVVSRFTLNNRRYALEDTFADREDISFRGTPFFSEAVTGKEGVGNAFAYLDELEKKNIGKYVYVPGISCPVIEVAEDGQTAKAQWLCSTYTFEGEAFGYDRLPYHFVRRIGYTTADMVRENGKWKVLHLDIRTFFRCPAINYDSWCQLDHTGDGKFYQRMGLSENRWKPALPMMGGDYPEELPFIDSVIAKWVNAYRRGEYLEYFEKNAFNDEWETIFHSRGQGRCAPPVVGTDAMKKFFGRGAFGYHHQQITNHGATSQDIQISADGRYATICAFDFNTTCYDPKAGNQVSIDLASDWNQENSGYEHTPARFQIAMYQIHLAKVQGEWKIHKVEWEQLGDVEDQAMAGKASRGWAGSVTDLKYPAIFEFYRYSPEKKLPGFQW